MSDRTPPTRRRIAGESLSPAPAQPVVTKTSAAKKAAAKKAAVKKAAAKKAPAKKPAAKKTPTQKAGATTAAPTPAPAAKKAPVATKAPAVKKAPAATKAPAAPAAPARPSTPQVARPTPRASSTGSRTSLDRRSVIALAAAAVVLVAGGVVGTLGFLDWRGDDVESSRTAAVAAASGAAETIFSFSYDELDQHSADSKALMTPSFAREFDTISPALTDIAPERKVVVESVTRNAAALPCGDECSTDRVSVLIFIDQDRRIEGEDSTTVFGNRIVVDMVKSGGDWKVNQIRAL